MKNDNKHKSKPNSTASRFGVFAYIISNITRHRWRTGLTVIGIAVPITFFILFAALGEGLDQYITSQNTNNSESYLKMSEIVKSWTNILLIIISILIITTITNTILMSTSERKFEIGVLRALGIKQEQIVYIALLEAFLISFIALIIGIILGIWSAILFDHMFSIDNGAGFFFAPARISNNSIIIASVLTLFIGTVTAIIPALRASHLNIIDILRCE